MKDNLHNFQEVATWEKLEALAGTDTKVAFFDGSLCTIISVDLSRPERNGILALEDGKEHPDTWCAPTTFRLRP